MITYDNYRKLMVLHSYIASKAARASSSSKRNASEMIRLLPSRILQLVSANHELALESAQEVLANSWGWEGVTSYIYSIPMAPTQPTQPTQPTPSDSIHPVSPSSTLCSARLSKFPLSGYPSLLLRFRFRLLPQL